VKGLSQGWLHRGRVFPGLAMVGRVVGMVRDSSSQLLSIEIPWNSVEFQHSTRNPQELMEEGKDLQNSYFNSQHPSFS